MSNKDRLYVALFSDNDRKRPGYANQGTREDKSGQKQTNIFSHRYRWGFCVCPKHEEAGEVIAGTCYRLMPTPGQIAGHSVEIKPLYEVHDTNRLLARILIAKVGKQRRLEEIIQTAQILLSGHCHSWMADVVERLRTDHLATRVVRFPDRRAVTRLLLPEWPHIRAVARRYVRSQIEHGRYNGNFDRHALIPTFCMLENRVIVP